MTQYTFTSADLHAFAELSGDHNPLHTDPIYARRLLFGGQVVHGLHALLWAVDHHFADMKQALELRTVKANFQSGIGVGQTVRCICTEEDDQAVKLQLITDDKPMVMIQLAWHPSHRRRTDHLPRTPQKPVKCRQRSINEIAGATGSLPLYYDEKLAAKLFPNLSRVLSSVQLAALTATTRLVGMECPGLHSIYAGLDLIFSPDRSGVPQLNYQVSQCNMRLALLSIQVQALGMDGEVKAFFRPKPQKQAVFPEICHEVGSEEFAGQLALIIGGSRGLGEVAAKLLAAGGAEVIITYCQGGQDAQRVVKEISDHGATADYIQYNVLEPSQTLVNKISHRPGPLCLYYFATPFIFGAAKGKFSARRFASFSQYYVKGFLKTFQSVLSASSGLQKVFYPSTAAIDELPLDMGEYAAAKTAGEILCDFLQKANPGLVIHKPRLPRIATDQTVSLLPVNNQDPVSVLLGNLRHLRQM